MTNSSELINLTDDLANSTGITISKSGGGNGALQLIPMSLSQAEHIAKTRGGKGFQEYIANIGYASNQAIAKAGNLAGLTKMNGGNVSNNLRLLRHWQNKPYAGNQGFDLERVQADSADEKQSQASKAKELAKVRAKNDSPISLIEVASEADIFMTDSQAIIFTKAIADEAILIEVATSQGIEATAQALYSHIASLANEETEAIAGSLKAVSQPQDSTAETIAENAPKAEAGGKVAGAKAKATHKAKTGNKTA